MDIKDWAVPGAPRGGDVFWLHGFQSLTSYESLHVQGECAVSSALLDDVIRYEANWQGGLELVATHDYTKLVVVADHNFDNNLALLVEGAPMPETPEQVIEYACMVLRLQSRD